MNSDQVTTRIVVLGLVGIAVVSLLGIVGLAYWEKPVPEILGLQAATSIGAVAALLSRTSHDRQSIEVNAPAAAPAEPGGAPPPAPNVAVNIASPDAHPAEAAPAPAKPPAAKR